MTVQTHKPLKHKKAVIVISIVLAVLLVITAGVFAVIKIGELNLRNRLSFNDDGISADDAYGDEADAYYNGKSYYYNNELVNILFIGVDKDRISVSDDHQADVLYLMSFDKKANVVNAISISRNTLADIDIYDMNGDFLATEKSQICLSYVYGSNDSEASLLTAKAVSRLLYDLPINGYYTVFMDSVAQIVDTVGGVKVQIPDDMTSLHEKWKKGANVILNGKDAMLYIRHRGEETNQVRMQRQQGFIKSFVKTAKSAVLKDLSLPLKMYNKLAKSTVTNVDASSAVYLATKAASAEFKLHTVAGKSGFDGQYETFKIDETALYEQVLDIFYK